MLLVKARGYKLHGEVVIQALPISIENERGSYRSGVNADGHEWNTFMHFAYGGIRGTEGSDGDNVDVYLGHAHYSTKVFIVSQNDPVTGNYDEDKVMLFFNTVKEAKQAYLKQYDRPGFFGSIDEVTMQEFKQMLKERYGMKLKKGYDNPGKQDGTGPYNGKGAKTGRKQGECDADDSVEQDEDRPKKYNRRKDDEDRPKKYNRRKDDVEKSVQLLLKGKRAQVGDISPDGRQKKMPDGSWGHNPDYKKGRTKGLVPNRKSVKKKKSKTKTAVKKRKSEAQRMLESKSYEDKPIKSKIFKNVATEDWNTGKPRMMGDIWKRRDILEAEVKLEKYIGTAKTRSLIDAVLPIDDPETLNRVVSKKDMSLLVRTLKNLDKESPQDLWHYVSHRTGAWRTDLDRVLEYASYKQDPKGFIANETRLEIGMGMTSKQASDRLKERFGRYPKKYPKYIEAYNTIWGKELKKSVELLVKAKGKKLNSGEITERKDGTYIKLSGGKFKKLTVEDAKALKTRKGKGVGTRIRTANKPSYTKPSYEGTIIQNKVIRPKDAKQIKILAQQIAEDTFDSNDHTIQPYDNKKLMEIISLHEKEYGEEARGILLKEYSRRYNKLNNLQQQEFPAGSFRQERKKAKSQIKKSIVLSPINAKRVCDEI